jgi:hypothetical protein
MNRWYFIWRRWSAPEGISIIRYFLPTSLSSYPFRWPWFPGPNQSFHHLLPLIPLTHPPITFHLLWAPYKRPQQASTASSNLHQTFQLMVLILQPSPHCSSLSWFDPIFCTHLQWSSDHPYLTNYAPIKAPSQFFHHVNLTGLQSKIYAQAITLQMISATNSAPPQITAAFPSLLSPLNVGTLVKQSQSHYNSPKHSQKYYCFQWMVWCIYLSPSPIFFVLVKLTSFAVLSPEGISPADAHGKRN